LVASPEFIERPRAIDFDLSGVEWSGRVVNAVSGAPLDSVEITATERSREVQYDTRDPNFGGAYCLSGPNGRFRLIVRAGSTYEIQLRDCPVKMYKVGGRTYGVIHTDGDLLDRIRPRRILNVPAGKDSTFDIQMEPTRK
jgi:hypothetical protein